MSLLLTLNIFHIMHDVNCQNTCFSVEKRKKSKFNRLQIKVFFLPNIPPPVYKSPPNIGPSNLPFARLYAQSVLKGFYRILFRTYLKKDVSIQLSLLLLSGSCYKKFVQVMVHFHWLRSP